MRRDVGRAEICDKLSSAAADLKECPMPPCTPKKTGSVEPFQGVNSTSTRDITWDRPLFRPPVLQTPGSSSIRCRLRLNGWLRRCARSSGTESHRVPTRRLKRSVGWLSSRSCGQRLCTANASSSEVNGLLSNLTCAEPVQSLRRELGEIAGHQHRLKIRIYFVHRFDEIGPG